MKDNEEKINVIYFPCCPKEKIFVKEGSTGWTTQKCPRCGKMVKFDYDTMTARIIRPIRGASKILSAEYSK